jgi:Tol biopolymer transport system component
MIRTSIKFDLGCQRTVLMIAFVFAAIIGFMGFSQRSSTKDAVFQPAALGRLAYDRTDYTTGGIGYIALASSNSDGTGTATLAGAGVPPIYNNNPSWKADGTRIVYETDNEIWVMNADGSQKVNLTNTPTGTASERNPSWSPTGKIAYERDTQIWTMNADGTGQTPFTAIAQPSPAAPAYSPDGTKLAFQSGGDIWIINADGTNEHRVTISAANDSGPAWSPDGTKIIFAKVGTGISIINIDGTNEIALTNWGQDSAPSWSNDGTKIAFVRRGGTANGIYVMDAVGGNQIRILADNLTNPGRTEHNNPAWQPTAVTPNTVIISGRITRSGQGLVGVSVALTGTSALNTSTNSLGEYRFEGLSMNGEYTVRPSLSGHIFTPAGRSFASPASNRIADFAAGQTCSTPNCRVNGRVVFVRGTDIYTAAADGTEVVNLINGSMGICEDPAFSPDGNSIIFRSNAPGNYEIYRMATNGSALTRLTNAAGTDEYPVYSNDGSKIVFTSDRDGNQEIYTMNADGSNQQRLTNNTVRDTEPAYSPDGAKIAFSRVYETVGNRQAIFTMNADGSNVQQITTPGVLYDFTPSYSPDGTKLLFWRYDSGPFTSQFYIANSDGTNPVPLAGASGFVYKPSFSPDGTKVIYSRRFDLFTNNVEYVSISGGGGTVMVQNGNHVDWQPVVPTIQPTRFDFDGDGRADIAVFRPSEGVWYILRSSDLGLTQRSFALSGDLPVPSDMDGDTITDVAIYRPSNSDFWSLSSATGQQINAHLGQAGDVPVPSDIDGDGRSDYVVYRPSNGHWYRVSSSTGSFSDIWFGAAGDKPVVGDFDGDGKADPAIFRPSDGNWWWLSSLDGVQRAIRWGIAEDIPSPADFDGDGRTDFAVFRPSTGVWYIINSSNGSFTIFPFGLAGDKPVPADYDGDGKADVAVYRPSDGTWYLLRSSAGFTGFRWGIASDVPLPNALIR